jgi:hypothetical protein
MCSGCSDYYQGDEADDVFAQGEAGEMKERQLAGWKTALSGSWALDPGEYEIAVSADAIIERRRIRCKPNVVCLLGESSSSEAWEESRRRRQRFSHQSARYYQALNRFQAYGQNARGSGAKYLIFCGLYGLAAIALAWWTGAR